jgi:hypothetical protein
MGLLLLAVLGMAIILNSALPTPERAYWATATFGAQVWHTQIAEIEAEGE